MPAGLSEAFCSWMPVDSCVWVWPISASSVCICWEASFSNPMVEMRMVLRRAIADCCQQRVEHSGGGLDHLRARLVGLLVLDHVGRFLIQVDAGEVVDRIGRRGVDGLLGLGVVLRLLSLGADLAHQGTGGARQGGRAAVQ